MGLCNSCESTHVATAKVIMGDGSLQEYSYPVRASYVLQKHPSTFICNSDHMEFDGAVSALDADDLLHPGNLYFALPLARLHRRLNPQEMAALAVKASSALVKTAHKCACRRKSLPPLREREDKDRRSVLRSSGRKGDKFTVTLTAIKE